MSKCRKLHCRVSVGTSGLLDRAYIVTTSNYIIKAIDPTIADSLRATASVQQIADSNPGYPCRQCLKDAEVGDELVLVSYDPFDRDSPYRSASPIYLHKHTCEPAPNSADIPIQFSRRTLAVRAYDKEAMMVDAAVTNGSALDEVIRSFLVNDPVDFIFVHNAPQGCWAGRVERI